MPQAMRKTMNLSDSFETKTHRRFRDLWKRCIFNFTVEDNEIIWRDSKGRIKGRATVVGVSDVPDRRGKRQHRIDLEVKRHPDFPGTTWLSVCARDAATKANWLAGLPQEIARKNTMLDEDGNPGMGTLDAALAAAEEAEAARAEEEQMASAAARAVEEQAAAAAAAEARVDAAARATADAEQARATEAQASADAEAAAKVAEADAARSAEEQAAAVAAEGAAQEAAEVAKAVAARAALERAETEARRVQEPDER